MVGLELQLEFKPNQDNWKSSKKNNVMYITLGKSGTGGGQLWMR